jgi:hypothetical protein
MKKSLTNHPIKNAVTCYEQVTAADETKTSLTQATGVYLYE